MGSKTNKSRRRKFNQPCGRHSFQSRKNRKELLLKTEEKEVVVEKENSKCGPYQLVRKIYKSKDRGGYCTKFIVRRIPITKDRSKMLRLGGTGLRFQIQKVENVLTGNRIVNLHELKSHVLDITTHAATCQDAQQFALGGNSPISLHTETNKSGMSSVLWAICHGCKKRFRMKTSTNENGKFSDINIRAVWGSMTTGGGASSLNKLAGTMGLPSISGKMFTQIEKQIGSWWQDILNEELAKAGAEEKELAIERGDFFQGVPAVTVICDGGWCKRSHKHTYNALGGVGVIFGAETKKLLYIGVRNKYCVVCSRCDGDVPEHTCFKNWTESSQSMEADIMVQGFMEAESVHGLRYMRLIADGDSSVYSQIQEKVPIWGAHVTKLECANHACKCLRASLERLVEEKPEYKGKGKLTKATRMRLTTAVRCAIRMRSKENDSALLAKDIRNSIHHVLGFHQNCSNFCKKKSTIASAADDNRDVDPEKEIDGIFEEQSSYWSLPSDKELDSSRLPFKSTFKNSELQDIIRDVTVLLNRLAEKSVRLIGNFTTDLAESWMAIRMKLDGGKVVNRCGAASWQARCFGGALRKNLGPAWSPIAFEKATGQKPGYAFIETFRQRSMSLNRSVKSKNKAEVKEKKRKKKLMSLKQSNTKKAKKDYGTGVLDDTPDVSTEELRKLCQEFLDKTVQKNDEEIETIEQSSKGQSSTTVWRSERKVRLTSSNFGKVMQRRPTNTSNKVVATIIYPTFQGNIHTIRGITQEQNTIIEYKNRNTGSEVEAKGLIICKDHNFLASSTDGVVTEKSGEKGLIEIKNLLQTSKMSIKDGALKLPSFCLESKGGKITLKTRHPYYHQVQGQLNILQYEWCDFVVRRTEPHEMFIQRIHRDTELWHDIMLPKLECFYMKFLLPELALPRYGTSSGIRTPTSPWYIPPKQTAGLKKRCQKKRKQIDPSPSNNASIDSQISASLVLDKDRPSSQSHQLPSTSTGGLTRQDSSSMVWKQVRKPARSDQ